MHRRIVGLVAAAMLSATIAGAQEEPFPVSVGIGGGSSGFSSDFSPHLLFVVAVTPPRSPIALRLDGLWREPAPETFDGNLLSAVSASAVVTLRPWRVSPYLVVGLTRSSEYVARTMITSGTYSVPARTELTGGAGLATRMGRATVFGELRELGRNGSLLTFGVTF